MEFTVQDNVLGAERLLTLAPLPSHCPLSPSQATRDTFLELFRGLQHPYVHPVLDVEFWDAGVAVVTPLNPSGSLKDLIYGSVWHEAYDKKYASRGGGFALEDGNVIIQNGVARLAGLENTLLGASPRCPSFSETTLSFGYLLFEMTAGYELAGPHGRPSPAGAGAGAANHLRRRQDVAGGAGRLRAVQGVELRELRGAGVVQTALAPHVLELLDAVRNPALETTPTPPMRRKDVVVIIERRLEDIIEEDNEDSDCDSSTIENR
ncbi:hypothetical protein NQ318_022376 [Aromia moschata]|uniref:Uncharacterized protein n=1 Tax=Aromia moschata TaxID=1265417 RepID=A0AAV8Z4K3_9CUCU|nr:hypothetical protein NQ318_022376 [Aromia moschata]